MVNFANLNEQNDKKKNFSLDWNSAYSIVVETNQIVRMWYIQSLHFYIFAIVSVCLKTI